VLSPVRISFNFTYSFSSYAVLNKSFNTYTHIDVKIFYFVSDFVEENHFKSIIVLLSHFHFITRPINDLFITSNFKC